MFGAASIRGVRKSTPDNYLVVEDVDEFFDELDRKITANETGAVRRMPRRYRFVLMTASQRRLQNIGEYTRQTWGREQEVSFRRALRSGIRVLRDHPFIGVERSDMRDISSIQVVAQFRVYYDVTDSEVQVVDIRHGTEMDPRL